MNTNSATPDGKDPHLWEIAKKRAAFKSHFYTYLVINGFLWALWFFRNGRANEWNGIPWPMWVTLGWGIGLIFNYLDAYVYPKANAAEREYEKLKNQHK